MNSYAVALRRLGDRARALRLARDLQQDELATRAGLAPSTVMRFEQTGRASIENVLRIATALGADEPFDALFAPPKYRSIDEALAPTASPPRQRVRRRG